MVPATLRFNLVFIAHTNAWYRNSSVVEALLYQFFLLFEGKSGDEDTTTPGSNSRNNVEMLWKKPFPLQQLPAILDAFRESTPVRLLPFP